MNQNQIITISGDLGSGKSTVAALIGTRLGIPVISTGAFLRIPLIVTGDSGGT